MERADAQSDEQVNQTDHHGDPRSDEDRPFDPAERNLCIVEYQGRIVSDNEAYASQNKNRNSCHSCLLLQ
jgi:hypothetical protein